MARAASNLLVPSLRDRSTASRRALRVSSASRARTSCEALSQARQAVSKRDHCCRSCSLAGRAMYFCHCCTTWPRLAACISRCFLASGVSIGMNKRARSATKASCMLPPASSIASTAGRLWVITPCKASCMIVNTNSPNAPMHTVSKAKLPQAAMSFRRTDRLAMGRKNRVICVSLGSVHVLPRAYAPDALRLRQLLEVGQIDANY